jgi:hypothetical protein
VPLANGGFGVVTVVVPAAGAGCAVPLADADGDCEAEEVVESGLHAVSVRTAAAAAMVATAERTAIGFPLV